MKLKRLEINNYRQFGNAEINFDDEITILAGANNSGKTSLVEILSAIFSPGTYTCGRNDISIKETQSWTDSNYDKIIEVFTQNEEREKCIREILKLLFGEDDNPAEIERMNIPSFNIEVEYEENEQIGLFADYLMELDLDCKSFYFTHQFDLNQQKFNTAFTLFYDELKSRLESINVCTVPDKKERLIVNLKDRILDLYIDSLIEQFYFTDRKYENSEKMDSPHFRKLFYFKHISAMRNLDDEAGDDKKPLKNSLLSNINDEQEWIDVKSKLPESISTLLDNVDVRNIVKSISSDLLNDVINEISKTNGGHTEDVVLDIDITNESIARFINGITNAKYVFEKYHLDEKTQGLGYSNLIYIHIALENYLKKAKGLDDSIVKIFVIEEPEAHMHPQMQKVFVKYLLSHYKEKGIQGLLTTHSNHIVRVTKLDKVRVARQTDMFQSNLYDLNDFINNIETKKVSEILLKDFYEQLFAINFADVVFADKIIIYEGETERMYIESILKQERFESLANQYISYIQSGGAYAHIYEEVIKFLNIKTLIITDLDYKKKLVKIEEIKSSETTNAALKYFYKTENGIGVDDDMAINVESLLQWQAEKMKQSRDDLLYIAFQGKKDKYARTLEEAMLAKYYDLDMESEIDWKAKRDDDKLRYSIPREGEKHNVRKIVDSTGNQKTDFMYSVILNNKDTEMLPSYIEEGLKWLMK